MNQQPNIPFLSDFINKYQDERVIHVLNRQVGGNAIYEWLLAVITFFIIAAVLVIAKKMLIRRFGRASESAEGVAEGVLSWLSETFERTRAIVIFLFAVYIASLLITLPDKAFFFIRATAFIAAAFQVGIWGNYFFSKGIKRYIRQRVKDPDNNSGVILMSLVAKGALWSIILLIVLQNLGINVSTLLASLGIGGIAIGLATQNIIGDLFASFSILLDRPFEVGHFIIVDKYLGTVEKIGIKTTRLRSLSGELLVFGNNDLLKSRIQNFRHFSERRVVFTFGVVYRTPVAQLEKLGQMVRQIIEEIENTRFDRAHLKEFGESAFVYECVYYVLNPDYTIYMDIQQKINLSIIRAFENEGIQFAFPTRTVHLQTPSVESS